MTARRLAAEAAFCYSRSTIISAQEGLMGRQDVTRESLAQGVMLAPGERHTLVFNKKHITVVELDDLTFHFGSSVLLPIAQGDSSPSEAMLGGLNILVTALQYSVDSGQSLLVAGHTDSVGSQVDNKTLSQARADNVLLFLQGNYDGWASACGDHKVEDYQLILQWVADFWSWDCHPGLVDNIDGPNTQRGLQRYSEIYNHLFDGQLDDSPVPTDQHWLSFAELYEQALIHRVDLQAARASLQKVGEGTLACGEHWPENGKYRDSVRSQENRRVELLFFADTDLPDFAATEPAGYDIYGTDLYFERTYLEIPPEYRFYFSL